MPHLRAKGELWRQIRVLLGEFHLCHEHTPFPVNDASGRVFTYVHVDQSCQIHGDARRVRTYVQNGFRRATHAKGSNARETRPTAGIRGWHSPQDGDPPLEHIVVDELYIGEDQHQAIEM